jgi:hypothetical protein
LVNIRNPPWPGLHPAKKSVSAAGVGKKEVVEKSGKRAVKAALHGSGNKTLIKSGLIDRNTNFMRGVWRKWGRMGRMA